MTVYSHSKLSSFEQCPLKYKCRYIDNIPVEFEETIESFLGNKVHEVLEWLYDRKEEGSCPNSEEVIYYYEKIWVRDFKEGIKINSGFGLKYYFEKGKKLIKDYYEKNYPFKEKTLGLEEPVSFNLNKDQKYKIRGFIDRIAFNEEIQEYEIHDYKTTKSIKAEEELHEDRQLALYCLALKQKYPDAKKIALVWHFLNFNRDFRIYQTQEKLEKIEKETIELIKRIEGTKEFPAKTSPLCGWCEFQGICSEFKDIQLNKYGNISKINENLDKNQRQDDEKNLVDEFCKLIQKENQEQILDLKQALISYSQSKNTNILFGSKNKIFINKDKIKILQKN